MEVNIFEYAVRNKIRFPFRGLISVEDLWDLSLANLDSIYKSLNKQAKQSDEESLLSTKTNVDTELEIKINIVKYIVSIKLEERKARENETMKKIQKQKISLLLQQKRMKLCKTVLSRI